MNAAMRLTEEQRRIILEKTARLFGPQARVRLFGSRVDDNARGGDIDLCIEVDRVLANRAAAASRLIAELQLVLGDQRLDVIIVDPATAPQPIHQQVRRQGIVL